MNGLSEQNEFEMMWEQELLSEFYQQTKTTKKKQRLRHVFWHCNYYLEKKIEAKNEKETHTPWMDFNLKETEDMFFVWFCNVCVFFLFASDIFAFIMHIESYLCSSAEHKSRFYNKNGCTCEKPTFPPTSRDSQVLSTHLYSTTLLTSIKFIA